MKKFFIVFILINIFTFSYSQDILMKSFPRTEPDLDGIYIQRLFVGQSDEATQEEVKYSLEVLNKIESFINKHKTITKANYPELIGIWKLCDKEGNLVENANEFFLSSYIIIENYKNNLYFINNSSETKIVKNNDDSLYFLTRWLNCIRQLKIIDGQMYIYTLDADNWSLDLIHEDGKYAYIKQ